MGSVLCVYDIILEKLRTSPILDLYPKRFYAFISAYIFLGSAPPPMLYLMISHAFNGNNKQNPKFGLHDKCAILELMYNESLLRSGDNVGFGVKL